MDAAKIAKHVGGAAIGGVLLTVIARGIAPVDHRMYLDYLLMFFGAWSAYDVATNALDTDGKVSSVARTAGTAIGVSYMTGGTRLTRQLRLA